jgi:hypothetical protein
MSKEIDYVKEEQQEQAKQRYDAKQATAKALRETYGKNREKIILQNDLSMREELDSLTELDADPALREEKRLDVMNRWNNKKNIQLELLKKEFEASGFKENEMTVGDLVK